MPDLQTGEILGLPSETAAVAALYTFAFIWLTLEVMPFQEPRVLSGCTTVRSSSKDPGEPA
jgi:hypothetical protein